MNITKILVGLSSMLFFIIGADKFLDFMEPPCSLMNKFSTNAWHAIGVLQIVGGILIWLPKLRKYVAGFFCIFMIAVSIRHLLNDTYDIGGAVFMAVLLGLLMWNPSFIR